MNEAETRAEYVDLAIEAAGWGVVDGSRILRAVGFSNTTITRAGRHDTPFVSWAFHPR